MVKRIEECCCSGCRELSDIGYEDKLQHASRRVLLDVSEEDRKQVHAHAHAQGFSTLR